MKTRRSVHQTQWAAQFAVASELCKRAYQVALTLGNHPTVDLMVISPCGEQFVIDVKGQYRKAFWPVTRKPPNLRVFYVLAFVPDNAPNRFFVLTQAEVTAAIDGNILTYRDKLRAKGKITTGEEVAKWMTGIEWRFLDGHENKWEKLPK
jgi:hypothetical protein